MPNADYSKCKLNLGLEFQKQWLTMFITGGVQNKLDFQLRSEVKEAQKFDDIVFCYQKKGKRMYRMMQTKYTESKVISLDNLLNDSENDVSLLRYFIAYRKLKDEFKDGIIKDLILCTNRKFLVDNFEDIFDRITKMDDVLNIGEEDVDRYKFKKCFPKKDDKDRIYEVLKNGFIFTRLVNKLIKCVLYKTDLSIIKNDFLLGKYWNLLTKHVINEKEKSLYIEFLILNKLSQLPKDILKFRDEFERAINKRISDTKNKGVVIEKLRKSVGRKNTLEKLAALKIPLIIDDGSGVSNNVSVSQLPNDVNDQEIKDFLNLFALIICNDAKAKMDKIIMSKMQKQFFYLQNENGYKQLLFKAGEWLTKTQSTPLTLKEGIDDLMDLKHKLVTSFDVPKPLVSFTGRSKEMEELDGRLNFSSNLGQNCSSRSYQRPVVVCGLGGVGKSELIKKYIVENEVKYSGNIMWINAENEESLSESLTRLAKDELNLRVQDGNKNLKEMKSILKEIYLYFSEKKCLFVFDNMDDEKTKKEFEQLLPEISNFVVQPFVIITSRIQKWSPKFEIFLLKDFTENDAINFVETSLGINLFRRLEVIKLVRSLHHFPLALQEAVHYLKYKEEPYSCYGSFRNRFDFKALIKELDKTPENVLSFPLPNEGSYAYTQTTCTVWDKTIERIQQEQEGGIDAMDLLDKLSQDVSENISFESVRSDIIRSEEQFHSGLKILLKYSMIQKDTNIYVHGLVKKVMRIKQKMK